MKKFAAILVLLLLTSSCRVPESFGFYQPITMKLAAPDGPPEYKAGWYAGCRTALANRMFANAFVYRDEKSDVTFGNGVYQHDSMYQTGWGQAYYACITHIYGFVDGNYRSFSKGPLE